MTAIAALTVAHEQSLDAPAVRLRGATKRFGDRTIFADLDLEIVPGEFVALLGASGSGKTTLLRVLIGLEELDGGTGRVARPYSVVFQEPRLNPSQKVWRNVLLGLDRAKQSKARAVAALEEVSLGDHVDDWPATLSGGEAQRVALARALIHEPQLLLLDEPFAALDALTRLRMQDLVRELCRVHRPGTLFVTHDVDEAIRLADRVLVLSGGRLTVDVRVDESREPTSPYVAELRQHLLAALGVSVTRA